MAATEKFANNYSSTLNGTIVAGATSLTPTSTAGAPGTGQFRILIDSEIIIVGSVSGGQFQNLTRGADGTAAAGHTNGATITHILTAGSIVNNPRSMANKGDMEYLNGSSSPASLAAPADGTYAVAWASQVPSWSAIPTVPSGVILAYGGSSAPSGYLLCDGSAVSRAGQAALFAAIGTTYGAGDGSTTFNLPDLRQRFPLGKAASGTGSTLGASGGAIDHVHVSQAPGLAQSFGRVSDGTFVVRDGSNANYQLASLSPSGGGSPDAGGAVIGNSNTSSNNPPYQVVNFIIKT